MASTTTANSQVIRLTNIPPTLPNIPANYPLGPAPGKLELLLDANDSYLYHKFTPFTNFQDSILSTVLSNQQPFVYTFIDQADSGLISQLPSTVQSLLDIVNINQDSISDVVRVSKFLVSSWGVQFLINQAAIQRLAPFDETRIYNPASPLLAAIQPLTLGIGDLPTRHIEGGLLGFVNSVTSIVGINLESGFQTPSSTAGNAALPSSNTGQGKGLIRGGDAGKGYAQLQVKWPVSTPQPSSTGIASLTTAIANAAGQMFGTTNINQPPGTHVRADESTYGFMATSYKLGLQQQWYPSLNVTISPIGGTAATSPSPLSSLNSIVSSVASAITNPVATLGGLVSSLLSPAAGGSKSLKRVKFIVMPDGRSMAMKVDSGVKGLTINGQQTGYPINDGDTYGMDVGRPVDVGDFTNSDMLVQYSYYLSNTNNYPTKQSDATKDSVIATNKNLQNVINKITMGHTYNVLQSTVSYLLTSGGTSTLQGYDKLNALKSTTNPGSKVGVGDEYQNGSGARNRASTIDSFGNPSDSLRMASSFLSDGINMLGILSKGTNGKINTIAPDANANANLNAAYPGWTEWKPYEDDLIAFFFYDVVNDKYIPFRATVKGLSEGNTAYWDELRFIGRADQLYSYNGFSRTLSFTFNVVISSVTELLPTWKKINYLASSVKPSNYTKGQNVNQTFNRFIVPPMFMITIGDMYKFQPVVITSLNVNIPDDASWETLNEDNSRKWNYLNGIITAPNLGKNYGQLPREAEIVVTCNLLEKERAIVGGSHFGHEPRVDDWETKSDTDRFLTSGSADIPFLPVPTILHQNFVEWNQNTPPTLIVNTPPSTPTSTPTSTGNNLNSGNDTQLA